MRSSVGLLRRWACGFRVNRLLAAAGYDRKRYRGKMRMLRDLADSHDVVSLQEVRCQAADAVELMKVFRDLSDSRNVGALLFCCAVP